MKPKQLLMPVLIVMATALTLWGLMLWHNYSQLVPQITTRNSWLGSLSRLQSHMVDLALSQSTIPKELCEEVPQAILKQDQSTRLTASASTLLQNCTSLESTFNAQVLASTADSIQNLIVLLRAENRALSGQMQSDTHLSALLLGTSLVLFGGILTLHVRSRLALRFQENTKARDVQELVARKLTEDALRHSEERLATTLFSIRDAIITTDEHGVVERMNPKAEIMTGWSWDDARGQPLSLVLKLVNERGGQPLESLFEVVARGGGTEPRRQVYVVDRSGGHLPVERTVAAIHSSKGFLGVVIGLRDISLELESMQAIQQTQHTLNRILDILPEGVVILQDGQVFYANQAFATLLGFQRASAVIEQPFEGLLLPSHRSLFQSRLQDPSLPLGDLSFFNRARGGSTLEGSVDTSLDLEDRPGLLYIFRETTRRNQDISSLVQTDRLLSIGFLMGGVLNQLNSPLSSLYAALMEQHEQQSSPLVLESLSAYTQIAGILRDLQSISVDDLSKSTELVPVVESCIRLAALELKAHAVLQIAPWPEKLPLVQASRLQLAQLIMGLLLYVLSNPSPERKLLNLAIQYQQQLKLVLQSTPGWEQDRIATRASLAALQGLANLIGASLNLDRTPASISIQVELPIAPPLKAVAPLSKGQSSLKVLILDDEEKVATSLKRVLNQHQVTLATTVAKALAVLEQVRVDVIICDVILGDETAIDLYTAVQKRWLELQSRMVFMSGAAYTTQARAFLESVPNPRFDKPFQIQAVRDLIGSFSPLDT